MNLLQPSVPKNCDMHIHASNHVIGGHKCTKTSRARSNSSDHSTRLQSRLRSSKVTEIFIKDTFRNDGKAAVLLQMRLKRISYCKQLPHLVLTKRHFFCCPAKNLFFFLEGGNVAWGQRHGKIYSTFSKGVKVKSWKLLMRKWSHVTD